MSLITILWTVYLAAMMFFTYDLVSSTVSRIVRGVLDTDITYLLFVSMMWAVWYMYFIH